MRSIKPKENNPLEDDELITGEIHLRQLTVDEAIIRLDKYLNDAFMAGVSSVSVVHGKGTGTLRRVIREYLARHSLVKSQRPGGHGEGGDGVTIVELFHR